MVPGLDKSLMITDIIRKEAKCDQSKSLLFILMFMLISTEGSSTLSWAHRSAVLA